MKSLRQEYCLSKESTASVCLKEKSTEIHLVHEKSPRHQYRFCEKFTSVLSKGKSHNSNIVERKSSLDPYCLRKKSITTMFSKGNVENINIYNAPIKTKWVLPTCFYWCFFQRSLIDRIPLHVFCQSAGQKNTLTAPLQSVRPPPKCVPDMILKNPMVWFQWCWCFAECRAALHCHRSQVNSDQER